MQLAPERKDYFQQRLGELLQELGKGIGGYRMFVGIKTAKILERVHEMCQLTLRLRELDEEYVDAADVLRDAYLERYEDLKDNIRKFDYMLSNVDELAEDFEMKLICLAEEDTLNGIPDSLKEFQTWLADVLAALKTQEKHLQMHFLNMQPHCMPQESVVHLWKKDLELEEQLNEKISLGLAKIELLNQKPLELP